MNLLHHNYTGSWKTLWTIFNIKTTKMNILLDRNCSNTKLMLQLTVLSFCVSMSLVFYYHRLMCNKSFCEDPIAGSAPTSLHEGQRRSPSSDACTPVRNVYFLKVHKTGSTTLYGILNRVAIHHQLRVVTYNKRPYDSIVRRGNKTTHHPIIENVIPKFTFGESEKYNMLIDHSFFELSDINAVLHNPVTFITMLRNPLDRVRSWLFFTGKGKNRGVPKSSNYSYFDPVGKFWLRPNAVAHVFGVRSMGWLDHNNLTKDFTSYVRNHLDKRFLVGIMEYYDHSVILFKRHLCLALRDVIFLRMRKQTYHKHVSFDQVRDEQTKERLCRTEQLDCYLYEYFNRTFWLKIALQGEDFYQELAHFRTIQDKVSNFCSSTQLKLVIRKQRMANLNNYNASEAHSLHIEASRWNDNFSVMPAQCLLMRLSEPAIANYHYYTQNKEACSELLGSASRRCRVVPKPKGPKYCDGMCKHAPDRRLMLRGLLETKRSLLLS